VGNEVTIRFRPSFREAFLSGQKITTARMEKRGEPGDWFEAFGVRAVLLYVSQVPLQHVADCWHMEGCKSRLDFVQVWIEIHPGRGFDEGLMVWLHRFRKLGVSDRQVDEVVQPRRGTW